MIKGIQVSDKGNKLARLLPPRHSKRSVIYALEPIFGNTKHPNIYIDSICAKVCVTPLDSVA